MADEIFKNETYFSDQWPTVSPNVNSMYANDAKNHKAFHVDALKDYFKDFARPNLFKVSFDFAGLDNPIPDNAFLSGANNFKTGLLVKSVNLPSFEISKHEIKRMGQRILLPASQILQDIQMSLICDDNYTSRKFLLAWIKRLVYDADVNYYKKFTTLSTGTLTIYQLDNKFNVIFGVKFFKVFPTTIGEIQFSQDSDSQVVEFPATFAYSTFEILSNDTDL